MSQENVEIGTFRSVDARCTVTWSAAGSPHPTKGNEVAAGSRSTPLRRVALVLATLGIATLAVGARADAYIYWAKSGPDEGAIARANLDGTGVDKGFITGIDAGTVAVGARHVYWSYPGTTGVGRARLDGTKVEPSFIKDLVPSQCFDAPQGQVCNGISDLAVSGDHIYAASNYVANIGRANLDGTGVDESFITTPDIPLGLAVDADNLYWTSWTTYPQGAIGRADLNGTGVNGEFISGLINPVDIAVHQGHVYWPWWNEPDTRAIGRASIDGSGVEQSFITLTSAPTGVAIDGGHLYWTSPDRMAIGRANVDGKATDEGFIGGVSEYASDLAVDDLSDTTAPETTLTRGAPKKTDKTKLKFEFTASEPNSTFECKKDKKPFKSCSSPTKMKHLDEGKHKFKVRAIDAAGNVDPSPATDKFKVVG